MGLRVTYHNPHLKKSNGAGQQFDCHGAILQYSAEEAFKIGRTRQMDSIRHSRVPAALRFPRPERKLSAGPGKAQGLAPLQE